MKELLNLASKYKVPVLITEDYLAFYIGRLNTNDKLELRIDLEMKGYKLLESFVDRVGLKEVV